MVLMTPPQQVAPFPPPDAREENKYKIKRNESFASVAMDNGIADVWQLIDYNLETDKSPRVVNWYLWHRYKCRRTTPSGKNLLFDGGEIIYLPNKEEGSKPEPPLPEGVADPEQLAKLLDLDPKSLKKFINEYGWGVNVAEGVTALIVEFAAVGAAGAAAGAGATVGFAVLGPVLVLISYAGIMEDKQARYRVFAACYQYADWVLSPRAYLTQGWAVPPKRPLKHWESSEIGRPPYVKKEEYDRDLAAYTANWDEGARQMREGLRQRIRDVHVQVAAKSPKGLTSTLPQVEDALKLLILTKASRRPGQLAGGQEVLDLIYKEMSQVHARLKFPVSRIPYPSTDFGRLGFY